MTGAMGSEPQLYGSRIRKWYNENEAEVNVGILIIILVLITISLAYCYFHTSPIIVRVVDKSWERTVNIEKLTTCRETSNSMPSGARLVREWTRHYTKHHSETTYSGSGKNHHSHTRHWTTYHSEQMYDFDIDRWLFNRTININGHIDEPKWPDLSSLNRGNNVGCEREGEKHETYTVYVSAIQSDENFSSTKEIGLREWLMMPVNSTVLAQVNSFGNIMSLSTIEGE